MSELNDKVVGALGRRVNALLRAGCDPDDVLDALVWQTMVLAATLDREARLARVGAEMMETAREAVARGEALARSEPSGSA